ncbi:YraN family protein [Ruficoccus sp. ZRK36]|uniref:YraN family protein n=1 Tax=Ruficoccus sp. ZRK36 TaxID=2866311 RepID=UPI001C73A70A|nr:YraN family protein [Ruficoccus sp. ZRK36]QYY36210.1 YraN family protein [Ruficoccus sp. ZRK36]
MPHPLMDWRRLILEKLGLRAPADRAGRGRFGERRAASYLRKQGYRILARNWRAGNDEIDLVCQDGQVLVFVEVRSRDESALVGGFHSVTEEKKTRLRRVCKAYLKSLGRLPVHTRFDIVELRLGHDGDFALYHHPNVSLFN